MICIRSLLFFGFIAFAQSQLPVKQELQAENDCIRETEVNPQLILQVFHTLAVPPDGPISIKYKEFLNCYHRKQGFLDDDGNIRMEHIKKVLIRGKGGYTAEQADEILDACKYVNENDSAYKPYYLLACLFPKAKQVDNDIANNEITRN